MAADLIFHGHYTHKTDLTGLAGLTVTIDAYRTTISDGTTSQVVTAGACTETGGGVYRYRLAAADPTLYHYVGVLKTTSADVTQKHLAALGMVIPDELVSTRLATAGYTAPPSAAVVSDAVWDEAMAGHAIVGSTGAALSAAGAAGDPWASLLPGDYTAGQAGHTIGNFVSALSGGTSLSVVSKVNGSTVTVYAKDDWSFTVGSAALGLSGYDALAFVVKLGPSQTDAQALLYMRDDDGLVRINGAEPTDPLLGTFTATDTTFSVAVDSTVTDVLPGDYQWWLKGLGPETTLISGLFEMRDAWVRAIE